MERKTEKLTVQSNRSENGTDFVIFDVLYFSALTRSSMIYQKMNQLEKVYNFELIYLKYCGKKLYHSHAVICKLKEILFI